MIDRNKHWSLRYFVGHWPIGHWPLLVSIPPSVGLGHTASYILREHLTGLGLVGDIYASVFWPCYISYLPDVDGNVISIYDTTPIVHNRVYDGMYELHYGIQIIMKSETFDDGLLKMRDIFAACENINNTIIAMNSSTSYIIGTCAFTSGVIYLGREWMTGRRSMFTLNLLCTIGVV